MERGAGGRVSMTEVKYTSITPREADPGTASRLFSFARIRNGATVRFLPGDGARLHFANREADTLEMPGLPAGFLRPGDSVTATYRGRCVFRGEVERLTESMGRGGDATQSVTCAGPWAKMARLVFRQEWFAPGGPQLSSRLILNQTRTGLAQSLDAALSELAGYGAGPCGYRVGTVAVSGQVLPSDECRDITVADAIRRELRLFPKAMARFDYSDPTPTLDIARPSAAATAAYVADIPESSRERIYDAHPITGVDLEIEAIGTVDGIGYRQIGHQAAGDATAGNPDCLYATLQIRGASSSAVKQSFESVTEDIPGDLDDADWWRERHPRLAGVAPDAIMIEDGARTPDRYPRISAATAGEIEAAGLHCEVSTFTCRARIETEDDVEDEIFLTLQYLTTDAEGTRDDPKTYTWVTESSAESGETVPEGLAATILAERSGTLLSERMTVRLGDSLPMLGDAIVEDGGEVYLQTVDIDCGDLTAELRFGVPDRLAPEDMASLLSGFRNKRTTTSSAVRVTGRPRDGGEVEMGAIPPLSSSEFRPGVKSKTTIMASRPAAATQSQTAAQPSGGRIVLDSGALGDGETMRARTMPGGVKVLATGPLDGGGMFPWDPETKSIGDGAVMVARTCVAVGGKGPGLPDGLYQLKVTLGATPSVEIEGGAALGARPDGNTSYVPIYEIAGGEVARDYRGISTVQAYE